MFPADAWIEYDHIDPPFEEEEGGTDIGVLPEWSFFPKLMAIRHQFPQKTPPEYIRSSKVGPGFAGNSLIGQGDPRKGPTEDD